MRAIICLVLTCAAAQAVAQQGPSFDCGRATGAAEQLICADDELARLDRFVAERFSRAIAAAQALDAGAAEAEAHLRASQRGWISGRDECWKAADPADCVRAAHLRREAELVATWFLEDPTGTAVWSCGDSTANEVVTTFFDTTRPGVRIERGDTVDAGVLVPTASGARYEASFGRFIWIKDDEAIYREPDPDGTQFTCTRAPKG